MNILITGVGGPTPRSFAIALKRYSKYADSRLIATDINPLAYGLYRKDLFDMSYVVPSAHDPAYWSKIESIIQKHHIEYAAIMPEAEVIEWSKRAETHGLPCKSLLPSSSLASLLVDKAHMTAALDDLGIVPRSVSFSRDETDLDSIFDTLGNEFWVRSSAGTSGLGSLKVESQEALANWIEINPGVQHFLASTFLPGRNLACKLLYYNGKLLRSACAERVNYIMSKVAPSGITGNTSFGRLLNEPSLAEISSKALDRLFELSGSPKHGFYTVDFKEDATGRPYITEINVRHVAFTQCFAAKGANFAEDTIRLLSEDSSFERSYKYYKFEDGLIFLRDVDEHPIIMPESDLLMS